MLTRIDIAFTNAMKIMDIAIQKLQEYAANQPIVVRKLRNLCAQTEQAIYAAAFELSKDETTFPSQSHTTLRNYYFQAARFFTEYLEFLAKYCRQKDNTLSHKFVIAYQDSIIPGMHRGLKSWLSDYLAATEILLPSAAEDNEKITINFLILKLRANKLMCDLDIQLMQQELTFKRPEPTLVYAGSYDAPMEEKIDEVAETFDKAKFREVMRVLAIEQAVVKENLAKEKGKDPALSAPAIQALSSTAKAMAAISTEQIKQSMLHNRFQEQPLHDDPETPQQYFKFEWDDRITVLKKQNCLEIIKKVIGILLPDDQPKQNELFHLLAKNYEVFMTLIEQKQFRHDRTTDPTLIAEYLKNLACRPENEIKSSLAKKIGKQNVSFFVGKILPLVPKPLVVAASVAPSVQMQTPMEISQSTVATNSDETKNAQQNPVKKRNKPRSELEKLLPEYSPSDISALTHNVKAYSSCTRRLFSVKPPTQKEKFKGEKRRAPEVTGQFKRAKLA